MNLYSQSTERLVGLVEFGKVNEELDWLTVSFSEPHLASRCVLNGTTENVTAVTFYPVVLETIEALELMYLAVSSAWPL